MSYVAIMDRYTDGEWRASADQYESIMHAWESGAPRVTLTTEDGAELTLRTDVIVSVSYVDDATELRIKERQDRQRLESA